jgi:hypothetical protein
VSALQLLKQQPLELSDNQTLQKEKCFTNVTKFQTRKKVTKWLYHETQKRRCEFDNAPPHKSASWLEMAPVMGAVRLNARFRLEIIPLHNPSNQF